MFGHDALTHSRGLVYELVTGNDPSLAPAPYAITTTAQRRDYERFATRPGADRVHRVFARQILQAHGLDDEPVQLGDHDDTSAAAQRTVETELALPEKFETVLIEMFGPEQLTFARRRIYELVSEKDPAVAPRPTTSRSTASTATTATATRTSSPRSTPQPTGSSRGSP